MLQKVDEETRLCPRKSLDFPKQTKLQARVTLSWQGPGPWMGWLVRDAMRCTWSCTVSACVNYSGHHHYLANIHLIAGKLQRKDGKLQSA
jgi:hypothetical protein